MSNAYVGEPMCTRMPANTIFSSRIGLHTSSGSLNHL